MHYYVRSTPGSRYRSDTSGNRLADSPHVRRRLSELWCQASHCYSGIEAIELCGRGGEAWVPDRAMWLVPRMEMRGATWIRLGLGSECVQG